MEYWPLERRKIEESAKSRRELDGKDRGGDRRGERYRASDGAALRGGGRARRAGGHRRTRRPVAGGRDQRRDAGPVARGCGPTCRTRRAIVSLFRSTRAGVRGRRCPLLLARRRTAPLFRCRDAGRGDRAEDGDPLSGRRRGDEGSREGHAGAGPRRAAGVQRLEGGVRARARASRPTGRRKQRWSTTCATSRTSWAATASRRTTSMQTPSTRRSFATSMQRARRATGQDGGGDAARVRGAERAAEGDRSARGVAEAALLLASDRSSYTTGCVITVGGGAEAFPR